MKKLVIVLMAALVLIGTLMVSCNQNVGEDKLSSVTISEDIARSLSTSTTTNVKPVDQLTWYYKATKMDNGFFVTGQKTEWTELGTGLVGKSLGKMSYGDWKFEFQGRDVNGGLYTIVYYCDKLLATVNSEETMLTVPLKQGTGFNKAGIIFSDLIFTLGDVEVSDYVKSNAESVKLVVTEGTANSWTFTGTSYVPATQTKPAYIEFAGEPVIVGYNTETGYDTSSSHTYVFGLEYTPEGSSDATQIIDPFDFTVYIQLGYDMTISGDISAYEQQSEVTIEKTSETWTVQTAYTENTNVNSMVATTDATPAKLADATSEGQTTVNAPVAALEVANGTIEEGSTVANSVKVSVSSIETASVTFAAEADNNAFAGIDLKLIKKVTTGTESVTTEVQDANFGNTPVTVETYIAKGLTNVVLTYPANSQAAQPVLVSYDPSTGKLVFTTTHFSEFAVFADQYIFDKTTNMAYKLTDAGLLDGADFDDSHEYLLLDPTKANLVSDDIDVFNAPEGSQRHWTVLHDSNDVENTTDFAGGYGTKIEPYLIATVGQMQKISDFYSTYNYYKVKDGVTSLNLAGNDYIDLNGSFSGNGIVFTHVDAAIFGYAGNGDYNNSKKVIIRDFSVEAEGCFGIVYTCATTELEFNTIAVSGHVYQPWCASAFLRFGTCNYDGVGCDYTVDFVKCSCSARIYAYANSFVAILVGHSYPGANHTATLNLDTYTNDNIDNSLLYWTGAPASKQGMKYYGMGATNVFVNNEKTTINKITGDNVIVVTSGKNPEKIGNSYWINPEQDSSTIKASLLWQYTEWTDDSYTTPYPNLSGVGGQIGSIMSFDVSGQEAIELFNSVTSVKVITDTDEWKYTLEDGVLTLYTPTEDGHIYIDGHFDLIVDQFTSGSSIAIYHGSKTIARKDKAADWVIY